MILQKEQHENIKKEVVKYSKEYQSVKNVSYFTTHIEEKLNNFKPTIMVYGTYNAGKSTLINALFGKEELAKTGDAPETSKVSEYEYNGYTIYDTPGIHAPQEHEKVTTEHLKKCELVLFVLSNDGSFEEKYIYEKISEIVKLEKPILLVVNNKAGVEKGSKEEKEEFGKINSNLNKIGDVNHIENIETKVDICMVNAKTALKAKVEDKKLLLKNSNMLQLEEKIDELLNKSGSKEVQNALHLFIGDYIIDTLKKIDSKIDNPEMKKTQESITYLENLKQRTTIELQNSIQDSVAIVKPRLLELFLQKDQQQISAFIVKTAQDMQELLTAKLQTVSSEISSRIDDFNSDFNSVDVQIDSVTVETGASSIVVSNDATIDTTISVANLLINIVPLPVRPIVQAALAIFTVFSSSDEAKVKAEAEMDAKRQQSLAAKNKADEFGYDYKNKLLTSVHESINGLFNPTLKSFRDLSSQLDNDNEKLLSDKNMLHNILENISKQTN